MVHWLHGATPTAPADVESFSAAAATAAALEAAAEAAGLARVKRYGPIQANCRTHPPQKLNA